MDIACRNLHTLYPNYSWYMYVTVMAGDQLMLYYSTAYCLRYSHPATHSTIIHTTSPLHTHILVASYSHAMNSLTLVQKWQSNVVVFSRCVDNITL